MIEKLLGPRLHGMGEGYIHNWEHRLREAVRNLEAIVARELSDTAQEIGKRVDSCGQLGSYEKFKFLGKELASQAPSRHPLNLSRCIRKPLLKRLHAFLLPGSLHLLSGAIGRILLRGVDTLLTPRFFVESPHADDCGALEFDLQPQQGMPRVALSSFLGLVEIKNLGIDLGRRKS